MTEEEKINQRKNLLYDCEQAEIALSHLVEKAKSTVEALKDVTGLLEHHSNTSAAFNPEQPEIYRRSGVGIDLSNPKYKDAMNFDAVNLLVKELWEAKQKLYYLRQRRNATSPY